MSPTPSPIPFDLHPNFAYSTIATVPGAGASASATVAAGTGVQFSGLPFDAVICPAGVLPTTSNAEVTRVLARSGDTLYLARAQEGSTQRNVQVGDQIYVSATGKIFTDIEQARGAATYYTNETGVPANPSTTSTSPLYPTFLIGALRPGDYVVREIDGEVYQFQGTTGSYTLVDLGFSQQGTNAVTNTVASGYRAGAASYNAGNNQVAIDTKAFDPGGCLDVSSTYTYTAPVSGYYRISGMVRLLCPTAGTEYGTFIGTPAGAPIIEGVFAYTPAANEYPGAAVDGIVMLTAGQKIALYCYGSTAFSLYVGNGASDNFLSASLIAPLTNAPVQPNTGARAEMGSSTTLTPANTWTQIKMNTISNAGDDPGGHIDTTNGVYKVPSAGLYLVQLNADVTQAGTAGAITLFISRNGAPGSTTEGGQVSYDPTVAANAVLYRSGSVLMRCAAGDTIAAYGYSGTAGAVVNPSGDYATFMSVVKVDQPLAVVQGVATGLGRFSTTSLGTGGGGSITTTTGSTSTLTSANITVKNPNGAWVRVGFKTSGYTTSAGATNFYAVVDNGSPVQIGRYYFNATTDHRSMSGGSDVFLTQGVHTVVLSATAVSAPFVQNGDDWLTFEGNELP